MALNCAIHCAATLFGFYQVDAKKLKPDIWAISRVFRERGISLPLGWTKITLGYKVGTPYQVLIQ